MAQAFLAEEKARVFGTSESDHEVPCFKLVDCNIPECVITTRSTMTSKEFPTGTYN